MDDHQQRRLATLKHWQRRTARVPAVLRAWRERGLAVTAVGNERSDRLVGWLGANWKLPEEPVTALDGYLEPFTSASDFVFVMELWAWNDAVVVLAPANALIGIVNSVKEIYPNGFLVADQALSRGLMVDFDEDVEGAQICRIEAGSSDWV